MQNNERKQWQRTLGGMIITIFGLCVAILLYISLHFDALLSVYAFGFHADMEGFLSYPWGIFTYPWIHLNPLSMLLNIVLIFGLGQLYQSESFTSPRAFVWTFVGGSLCGGICFALCAVLDSLFGATLANIPLFGASAGICALAFRLAMANPRLNIHFKGLKLNFLFLVLLIYATSFLIMTSNLGGIFAHLGGALYGLFLAIPKTPKTSKNESEQKRKAIENKIRESGYKSLNQSERKLLLR